MTYATVRADFTLASASVSYWDSASGARFVLARPEVRPDLWAAYLEGLEETYISFGTERALDLQAIFVGRQLPMFVVAIGADGKVLAGVRAHGPIVDPDEAHALVEFEVDPLGQRTVRKLISERIPHGVTEIKGGWVAEDAPNRRELSNALARSFLHIMTVLDVEFAFCTAAVHAANRWLTVGGQPVEGLTPVPYPDDRYLTTMMWWNQSTYAEHCDPEQLRRIRLESRQLHTDSEVGVVAQRAAGDASTFSPSRVPAALASRSA
jgi:hypothetical protein